MFACKGASMKRSFLCIVCLLATNVCFASQLPSIPDPFTGTLKGESELYRSVNDESIYIDWMVSTQDLAANITDDKFVFSVLTNDAPNTQGNKAAYNASTYYYYYQLENDNVDNYDLINSLSLDLDPEVVVSAGYIIDVDLDTDLLEAHNLVDEEENNTDGEVAPDQSNFTPVGSTPYQNWQWDLGLTYGAESTVLFLSCYMPPEYSPSSGLSGAFSYNGYLPVPHLDTIPEPASMILLGAGLLSLLYKKKR